MTYSLCMFVLLMGYRSCTIKAKAARAATSTQSSFEESIEAKLPNEIMRLCLKEVQRALPPTKTLSHLQLVSKHFRVLVLPLQYHEITWNDHIEQSLGFIEEVSSFKARVETHTRNHTRHISLKDDIRDKTTIEKICSLDRLQGTTYIDQPEHLKKQITSFAGGLLLCELLIRVPALTELSITHTAIMGLLFNAIIHHGSILKLLTSRLSRTDRDQLEEICLLCPAITELTLEETRQEHEVRFYAQSPSGRRWTC